MGGKISLPPRGGYPGLGSLPPTPGNLANSNLKSYLIIYNLICEGAVYLTSLGRPTDIGLQLGKACYPCSG